MSRQHTLQEFSTQEGKNLELGQAGYLILTTTGSGAQSTPEGEWTSYMVLDGDVTITQTLHEPLGDSPVALITSLASGILVRGYWKRVSAVRTTGSDPITVIVYKG